jgi:hypothetical protein
MDGMYSTAMALRAIIAVFLERTLGRILIIATLVAIFIAIFSAYTALNGASLLWIVFVLTSALIMFLLLFTTLIFFAVFKLLPRKLSGDEKRRINRFSKTLLERLELARTPIPLLAWHLAVQALINQRESEQRRHLQKTIERSHSLNHEFQAIRGFFETR